MKSGHRRGFGRHGSGLHVHTHEDEASYIVARVVTYVNSDGYLPSVADLSNGRLSTWYRSFPAADVTSGAIHRLSDDVTLAVRAIPSPVLGLDRRPAPSAQVAMVARRIGLPVVRVADRAPQPRHEIPHDRSVLSEISSSPARRGKIQVP